MAHVKQVSLHGRRVYLTEENMLVAKNAIGTGGDAAPSVILPGSPTHVAVWEDFLTDMGMGTVNAAADTGAAGQSFITRKGDTGITGVLVAGTNGVFRFGSTITAATITVAATHAGFVGPQLAWRVNQGAGAFAGALRMAARVKK